MPASNGNQLPRAVIAFPTEDSQADDLAPDDGLHVPGMEVRLARLENQSARIEALVRGIDDHLRRLQAETVELKGRLASRPTTWVMVATMLAGQLALAGILIAALLLLFTPD